MKTPRFYNASGREMTPVRKDAGNLQDCLIQNGHGKVVAVLTGWAHAQDDHGSWVTPKSHEAFVAEYTDYEDRKSQDVMVLRKGKMSGLVYDYRTAIAEREAARARWAIEYAIAEKKAAEAEKIAAATAELTAVLFDEYDQNRRLCPHFNELRTSAIRRSGGYYGPDYESPDGYGIRGGEWVPVEYCLTGLTSDQARELAEKCRQELAAAKQAKAEKEAAEVATYRLAYQIDQLKNYTRHGKLPTSALSDADFDTARVVACVRSDWRRLIGYGRGYRTANAAANVVLDKIRVAQDKAAAKRAARQAKTITAAEKAAKPVIAEKTISSANNAGINSLGNAFARLGF